MVNNPNYLFTGESASEGHPDQISERVSGPAVAGRPVPTPRLDKLVHARVSVDGRCGRPFDVVGIYLWEKDDLVDSLKSAFGPS